MSSYVPVDNPYAQDWMRRNRAANTLRKSNTTPAYSAYQQQQNWLRDQQRQREQWADVVEYDSSLVYRRRQGQRSYGKDATGGFVPPVQYVPNQQAQDWLESRRARDEQSWMRSRGANRNNDTLKSAPKPALKSAPKPVQFNLNNYPVYNPQVQGPPAPAGYYDQPVTGGGGGYGGYSPYPSYRRGGGGGSYARVTPMQGQNQGGYAGRASQPQQYGGRYGSPQYRQNWLQTLTRLRIG